MPNGAVRMTLFPSRRKGEAARRNRRKVQDSCPGSFNVLARTHTRPGRLTVDNLLRRIRAFRGAAGVLVLAIVLGTVWPMTARTRGQMAANMDLRKGNYRLLTYGLPPTWLPEYARLLKERYRIELHPVAGCVVSNGLIAYVDGYDEVSSAAALHKFGHDVFKECMGEAQRKMEPKTSLRMDESH